MSAENRIEKAFEDAVRLPLDENTKYILLSDCHRGAGNRNDNFLKNEFLYTAALEHYFQRGFSYIELGDGDELWENCSIRTIQQVHGQSFGMLAKYYQAGRLCLLYGNHDIVKKRQKFVKKYYQKYRCRHTAEEFQLCPGMSVFSGAILQDQRTGKEIYLLHGHQADFLNSTLWPLSRFLVRYLWKPLERLGIPDPTSAAKNNTRKKRSESVLAKWAGQHNRLLISGHTHHPMIGTTQSPYFNTGSCIHPGGITGIEIENRCMTLVKWSLGTKEDMTLYAKRSCLAGKICIDEYGK